MLRTVDATGLHLRHLHVQHFSNGHRSWWQRLLRRPKPQTAFGPGITAVGILSESHIAVHTTAEDDYPYVDVFICRSFDEEVAFLLDWAFGVREWGEWQVVRR